MKRSSNYNFRLEFQQATYVSPRLALDLHVNGQIAETLQRRPSHARSTINTLNFVHYKDNYRTPSI